MTDYIKSIIIMGTVSSLVVMALPSDSDRVGKYVKYLSVLLLLTVMFSPIAGVSELVASVAEIFNVSGSENGLTAEKSSADLVVARTAENLSEYIKDVCHKSFGLNKDGLRVKLIIDESDRENIVIEEIQIFTDVLDRVERERIADYFKELFKTEVYVFGA